MRINARLDKESEKAIEFLRQATGLPVTEIVKHSLKLYVKELESDARAKNQQLLHELAGIAEGSSDGSETYKRDVRDYIDEKFADH